MARHVTRSDRSLLKSSVCRWICDTPLSFCLATITASASRLARGCISSRIRASDCSSTRISALRRSRMGELVPLAINCSFVASSDRFAAMTAFSRRIASPPSTIRSAIASRRPISCADNDASSRAALLPLGGQSLLGRLDAGVKHRPIDLSVDQPALQVGQRVLLQQVSSPSWLRRDL